MHKALSDKLEIWGYENDFILFEDCSLGLGLKLSPMDIEYRDRGEINEISVRLNRFLNGLPEGISIQWIQDIHADNAATLDAYRSLSQDAKNEFAKALSEERVLHYEKGSLEDKVPSQSLYLLARKEARSLKSASPRLFANHSKFEASIESSLESEISQMNRLRDHLLEELKLFGIVASTLTCEEISTLIYRQWNPMRSLPLPKWDPENIRPSLLFTDAQILPDGFVLGSMHHQVVSLKILPEMTRAGMASLLHRLPIGSRTFVTLSVPDQEKELALLQSERRVAFSMVRGSEHAIRDVESEAKYQDTEDLLQEVVTESEKIFHLSLNIVLMATSEDDLSEKCDEALRILRQMNGCEGMVETVASFDVFSEISIPNARSTLRSKRIKTSNASDFIPLYGPWPGHASPSLLLSHPSHFLMKVDPFSSSLSNFNQVISGASGSGKSFLTNLILLQMMKENPQVFIIDIGGSYRKLSHHLGGEYFPLALGDGISINPFDISQGEVPSSHKIKFLLHLIEIMAKEEGRETLSKLERAQVEKALQDLYQDVSHPTLSTLQQALSRHPDQALRNIASILALWCKDTPYGKFMDRPTSLPFTKPIVCCDLQGMEPYPDLQEVTLFLITDFISREVTRLPGKKIVVFDECWKLMASDMGSQFIGEVFRTFRKHFASAIAISQNLEDFSKSKVSDAILTNSSLKWILKQRGADPSRLKDVLRLGDAEMDCIESLGQVKGKWSEAFLIAEGERAMVHITPTPLEYWISTSDPRDLDLLEKTRLRFPEKDSLSLLKLLRDQYPSGACAG